MDNDFDLVKMLQTSVQLDRDIRLKHNLQDSLEDRIKNAYLALDVEISEVANTSEWFKVWKLHRGKHEEGRSVRDTVLTEYVDAVDFFLLIANLNQWNHLVPIDQSELEKMLQDSRTVDLTKFYLNVKTMLMSAYKYNRGADFKHAWHLFLKMGLVGFKYTPKEIQDAYFKKNKVNYNRQDSKY